jgi:acyl carrier protein
MTASVAIDKEELREMIATMAEVNLADLTDDAKFGADLEIDSLLGLEIQIALEDKYGVKIEEDEFERVTSLASLYDLLTEKQEAGQG